MGKKLYNTPGACGFLYKINDSLLKLKNFFPKKNAPRKIINRFKNLDIT